MFPIEVTEAHILPFIPDAAKIDQKKDKRLTSFAKILCDNASVHAVATSLMESEPWDFTAIYYEGKRLRGSRLRFDRYLRLRVEGYGLAANDALG